MASENPVRTLQEALAAAEFRVEPGRFALLGFPEPPAAADLALGTGEGPLQLVREGGETTLLVAEEHLAAALGRHPEAAVERELRWIRFGHAMDWSVSGFLALVTSRLAAAGVPLGAVCGYSRDHLFVAERHLERATSVLAELFPR